MHLADRLDNSNGQRLSTSITKHDREQEFIQRALANFAVLFEDTDFSTLSRLLRVGYFQFQMKNLIRLEWTALFIGLWGLALEHSFPMYSSWMFKTFCLNLNKCHPNMITKKICQRASSYRDLLRSQPSSDFRPVARQICSLFGQAQNLEALTVRTALHIRKTYQYLFERLL